MVPEGRDKRVNTMASKARILDESEIIVVRRGRVPKPLDSDLVSDLKKLGEGKVPALDLAGYFPSFSDRNKLTVGQKIRKHWTEGAGFNNKNLRLDFLPDEHIIQARVKATRTT